MLPQFLSALVKLENYYIIAYTWQKLIMFLIYDSVTYKILMLW